MERLIVLFVGLSVVLAVELPYFYGKFQETAGLLYMGTVHYPADYLYYLSQMVQGQSHCLFSTMLYTTEKLPFVLTGWQHVLWGKLMSVLGIRVIEGYQLMVVVTLSLFLFLSHKLIRQIFPQDKLKRILAFFFFATGTALPKIVTVQNGWDLSYWWYWYNHGQFQVRFGPTPHHLLANSMLLFILIQNSKIKIQKSKNFISIGSLILASVVLSSINPVYWGIISAVLFLADGMRLIRRIRLIMDIEKIKERIGDFLPFFLVFVSGLPVALYVRHVFNLEPYIYSHVWESRQQVWVNLPWLVLGSGLVIPLGTIGGIIWIREIWKGILDKKVIPACAQFQGDPGRSASRRIAITTSLLLLSLCSVLYMSPIPYKLGLTNVRFWASSLYVIWGALAAEGAVRITYYVLSIKYFKHAERLVFSSILLIYLVSVVPTHFISLREQFMSKKGDAFYYIPAKAYQTFLKAKTLGGEKTVYLVQWPFDETFPALTGRKSFFGYYLLTINAAEKEKLANRFFGGKMEEKEARKFLERNRIEYVIGYPWTPKINDYPFLKEEYKNGFLGVYRVGNE